MKYWLFDGSEILGPLSPQELAAQKGFGPESLVCPEPYSDQADQWQVAPHFEELRPLLKADENNTSAAALEKEMHSLLGEQAAAEADETPTAREASLRVPATPAKAGPIEEYFNTVKGEDLGNILGIPDPNENTDADLARVIESELAVSADGKEKYEPLRAAQEAAPEPVKPAAVSAPDAVKPSAAPAAKEPVVSQNADTPDGVLSIDLDASAAPKKQAPAAQKKQPVKQAKPAAQKPAAKPTAKPAAKPAAKTAAKPAVTKANGVEVEKFDTGGVQREEISAYREELPPAPEPEEEVQTPEAKPHTRSQLLMAVFACVLLFVLVRELTQEGSYMQGLLADCHAYAQEFFARKSAPLPDVAPEAAPEAQPAEELSAEAAVNEADLRSPYAEPDSEDLPEPVLSAAQQTALDAVQNYELSDGRGTVVHYLQTSNAPLFEQGFTADWSVAWLHRNIYIVQYRLTKPRTEPIVYVFQADGEKGKLTGALNNITLDLVGKIQQ